MSEQDPVLTIVGQHVALGPIHRGLLPLFSRWENDLALSILSGDPARPLTPEAIEAAYDRIARSEGRDRVDFAIYERAALRPIGALNLRDIDHAHRTAEYGISIGDPADRGKGYGTEATMLLLDYAFHVLGLHNVWLDTVAYNEPALRAYAHAGFKVIGRRRAAYRLGGHTYDVVLMDCVADGFVRPSPPALDLP